MTAEEKAFYETIQAILEHWAIKGEFIHKDAAYWFSFYQDKIKEWEWAM